MTEVLIEESDFGHRVTIGSVSAVFAGRGGGVSMPPWDSLNVGLSTADRTDHVAQNRELLAKRAGVQVSTMIAPVQVHGCRVLDIADADGAQADGVYCGQPGCSALIVTADCLPILIAGSESFVVLHAGWRGLGDGIVEAGINELRANGDQPLAAVLGVCAGPCCYEVGPEVHQALGISGQVDKRNLDLREAARERLAAEGVSRAESLECCTICDQKQRYFSHRANGPSTGRQGTLAWLNL